jgi:hypothetical protein
MDLTALVDLLAERIAQEINAVRAETFALLTGPTANAFSINLVAFDGGDSVIAAGTPVVDGGSAS